ncbi:MAG TPA: phosphate ABC transporter ATP-binding protein PstB [Ktedonosporobacter sp.]|jgi:phosphate transport system ATP-binding protein|nr:phosphate ABC transporter ATP-binding protein PstB [Ktedonosporobacter sp.]
MASIETRHVNAWYGKTQALYDITLNVAERSVTALIGPSGCGKSTFVRCLNRMHEELPETRLTGEVLVDGVNLYARSIQPMRVRRHIGMVFQQPNLLPHLSISENVALGLHLNGVARGKAVAEQVELSLRQAALWEEVKHRLHTPATELSGGQQQRLCIARALALSPQVILMDEPCSALDPISTLQVEELIRQLKKDYTVIIVTHNMQQAGRIADMTAFFLQGRLIEVGETKHFFAHPKLQETEDYLSGRFS